MAKKEPDKMTGTSIDISSENRDKLKQLFPTIFTETKSEKGELAESIDFEKLKAELGTFSDVFEARRERYGMDWPGKKEALRLIQTPSYATLKPCRKESVNFDTTENLFIEGDNLEALKLLQKSYYGKVKMIYIDPPYNTGNDFIYPDNYTESLKTYLEFAGLIDGEGKKFSTNTANEGRFHTRWLNMMYPRLYLARNMLRDDGVIFISIDDNEVSNLRKVCDEIFGEDNFCGVIKRRAARKTAFLSKSMTDMCDYVVVYVKSDNAAPLTAGQISDGTRPVFNEGNSISLRVLRAGAVAKCADGSYPAGDHAARSLSFELLDDLNVVNGTVFKDVPIRGPWRINQDVLDKTLFVTRNIGLRRTMLPDELDQAKLLNDLLDESDCYNEKGSEELQKLLGAGIFNNPKPRGLIEYLLAAAGLKEREIVLDFFAGSGTTGHAVMTKNASNESNCQYILIQLPEPLDPDNKDQKNASDFCDKLKKRRSIAELAKERLRRVIKNLDIDRSGKQDLGFKVLKLNKSNFKQWQKLEPSTTPEKIVEQLELHIENVDNKATPEDLLYEILLKAGFTPTEKIETKTIDGKKVFSVAEGALLLCLESEVNKELIDAIAEAEPMQFICLDSAFHGNDQLKANAVQTFAARNMQKEKHNQIVFKTV